MVIMCIVSASLMHLCTVPTQAALRGIDMRLFNQAPAEHVVQIMRTSAAAFTNTTELPATTMLVLTAWKTVNLDCLQMLQEV